MFAQALLHAVPDLQAESGDYQKDGLLHCGHCKTPRQMRITLDDLGERIVPILCSCREAAQRAEDERHAEALKMARLANHLRATVDAGIADPMPAWNFGMDDTPGDRSSRLARAYAAKFSEPDGFFEKNIGLMLYGPPGTGKTFLAGCIANELVSAGSHVLYSSIRKLTGAATRDFGADADYVQREVQRCSLLVLDDFGVERNTEFSWEQTERIVDWRYQAKRPLLITTNLNPMDMQGGDIIRQRVFDRVLEMCQTVQVSGESRRRAKAAEKARVARELFGEV